MEKEVTNNELARSIEEIAKSQKELVESQKGLLQSHGELLKSHGELAKSQESLVQSQKDLISLVENLAISTANGFAHMDTRFDTLEMNHEERLKKLEDKTRVIYTAFEKDLKIKLAN